MPSVKQTNSNCGERGIFTHCWWVFWFLSSVAMIKHCDQNHPGGEKGLLCLTLLGHSSSLREVRQDPGGRNCGGIAVYGLALLRLLSYLSDLPRNSTVHSDMGPPTLINKWENATMTCAQVHMSSLIMMILQVRILLSRDAVSRWQLKLTLTVWVQISTAIMENSNPFPDIYPQETKLGSQKHKCISMFVLY